LFGSFFFSPNISLSLGPSAANKKIISLIFHALKIRIDQQSIDKTAGDPNYVDILESIQVKMHITSLILLTAGVFAKPGTALLRTDQESCESKSPRTECEEIRNQKTHYI
jgi:hypothetical protein